jgi:cyclic pyranopterin phosphate synthase
MNPDFTHLNPAGGSRMVDVGEKPVTARMARASGRVVMSPEALAAVQARTVAKGDVLEVARLAGIQAAKRTWELVPLCHLLALDGVDVTFEFLDERTLDIRAEVRATARTGVEMEALTAVAVAALTVYDMCKSLDRVMMIDQVRLEEKTGGRSGHFVRP